GDDDPLVDAAVREALSGLDRPRLELLAIAGLFGTRVFPWFLSVLTDRWLQEDPFARLTGTRISQAEWVELLDVAEKAGVVQRILGEPMHGYYLPPTVSVALRGILAGRFDEAGLRELRRGAVAAAHVALTDVFQSVMSGDDTGYDRRRLR